MKWNENKFSDVILFKLYPIVNVFLVLFQTITLSTQKVEITLVQRYFSVVTLKQHYFKPLFLHGIYLNANTGMFMNTKYPI